MAGAELAWASRCPCVRSSRAAVGVSSWSGSFGEPRALWRAAAAAAGRRVGIGGRLGREEFRGVRARAAGVEDLLQNRVLVSCTVAAVLGQIAKPFTYALLGKGFNARLALTPGGMPSSHSATVTAAATALGLDRGLSDSLFGVAVILAALVMYDAQGVRRSVGKQAEVINTLVLALLDQHAPADSAPPPPQAAKSGALREELELELAEGEEAAVSPVSAAKRTAVLGEEGSSSVRANGNSRLPAILAEGKLMMATNLALARAFLERAEKLPSVKGGEVNVQEIGSTDGWRHIPLKESVGHTKVEVLVGAVWGIVVALGVHLGI